MAIRRQSRLMQPGHIGAGRTTATAMGHARKWRAVTLLGMLLSQALSFSKVCEAKGQVHQGSALISSHGACLTQSAVEAPAQACRLSRSERCSEGGKG